MKKIHIFIACWSIKSLIYAVIPIYESNWQVIHYGEIVLENLDYEGYITLDGTTVKTAKIKGYAHVRFSNFKKLSVKGHLMIEDSTVRKKTKIKGDMLAINVSFKGNVVCKSKKIVIRHCRLDDLIIENIDEPEEQIIYLSETSEILGKVIFKSGRGKVIATKDSKPKDIEGGSLEISEN